MILEVGADCARDFPYVHEFALGSKPQDPLQANARFSPLRAAALAAERRSGWGGRPGWAVIFAQALLVSWNAEPRAHPARGGARHAPSAPLGGRLPDRPRPRTQPRGARGGRAQLRRISGFFQFLR